METLPTGLAELTNLTSLFLSNNRLCEISCNNIPSSLSSIKINGNVLTSLTPLLNSTGSDDDVLIAEELLSPEMNQRWRSASEGHTPTDLGEVHAHAESLCLPRKLSFDEDSQGPRARSLDSNGQTKGKSGFFSKFRRKRAQTKSIVADLLPGEPPLSRNLRSLIADENMINAVPESIRFFTQLEVLSLNKNKVISVSDGIFALKRLVSLCLDDNAIPDFGTS